jgi:hypothetical protein
MMDFSRALHKQARLILIRKITILAPDTDLLTQCVAGH